MTRSIASHPGYGKRHWSPGAFMLCNGGISQKMKNFIQALVIIAVAMAIYNSRIPAWLQGQWSEDAASASHSGKPSNALTANEFTVADDALDSEDEAKMLEAFEQGYQSPGDCGLGQLVTDRCELHRQHRLEEFRRQWRAYYLR